MTFNCGNSLKLQVTRLKYFLFTFFFNMFYSFEPSKSFIAVILIKEFTECLDSCNTNASRPTRYPTEHRG